jgi:phage terminase small subunit
MQDVEMPTTLHLLEQFRGEDSAPPKEARLSDAQKEFCLQIIANGGNASQAALDAGYKHPEVASAKLMLNFGVVHMINRLTVELWKGKIPALLGNLHSVAFNPKATDRARVDATNSLLDRLGAIVPKGPSTAIQINNGGAGEGPIKAQAQIIITELWTARSEREQRKQAVHRAVDNIIEQNAARKVSRIDGTMTDTIDPALALLEHIADGDGMGGDAFSRVPSRPAHIPAPPDTYDKKIYSEENEDGYGEETDESLAADSDTAGGFGSGEGIGEADGNGTARLVGSTDVGPTASEDEIFSRFHSGDVVGSGVELADAGEVAGIDGSAARRVVVWSGTVPDATAGEDDTDAEAVDDAGSRPRVFQREREGGEVQPGGVDLFADD